MATRPQSGSIPDEPGSYQFVDADGRVLYVGKAKSLRSRVNSYFQDPVNLAPRTAQMVAAADHVEWMVVGTEAEALLLEHNLIKQFQPRFNVRLKDDKSYPWLALTVGDEWPKPAVVRGRKRKGVRYFGPYPNVGAIRGTLDLLLRSFPVRTCSDAKFRNHERLGRPCLLFHIERCSGPCVGAVTHEEYDRMVSDLATFLAGDTAPLERQIEAAMREASAALDFERAGALRDKLEAVRAADAVRQMELDRPEDLDVLGLAEDELEAAVQVFHVRAGRVVGRSALFVDKVEDLTPRRAGGAPAGRPLRRRRLRGAPPDPGADRCRPTSRPWSAYLAERRGGPVAVRVPLRGPKAALLETVQRNAGDAFVRHRLQRTSDHNSRARALEALQRELRLPDAPLRIECYDMSHLQGTDYVGSMVVFEDGLPEEERLPPLQGGHRGRQRRLRGHGGGAHPPAHRPPRRGTGAGHRRRGAAGPTTAPDPPSATRRRFAYPPQLLLIDGGLGPAPRGHPGARAAGPDATGSRWRRWPRASRRSTSRAPRTRSACPASPRPSTCSSGCATRPTASPSRTTGPCGASG